MIGRREFLRNAGALSASALLPRGIMAQLAPDSTISIRMETAAIRTTRGDRWTIDVAGSVGTLPVRTVPGRGSGQNVRGCRLATAIPSNSRNQVQATDFIWRPRRDLNPCYRRESGKPNRKRKKPRETERTGWRFKSSRKQINVSPMCPRVCVSGIRKN